MTEADRERAVGALEQILVGLRTSRHAASSGVGRTMTTLAEARRARRRVPGGPSSASPSSPSASPIRSLLAAAVAAILTVVWLCVDAYQDAEPPQWSLYRSPSPARTFDPRFSRLSQELDEASDRREASRGGAYESVPVADRILFDKYDVDRELHPEAARAILGEDVWSYLHSRPGSEKVVFSPQLFAVLDRLESL